VEDAIRATGADVVFFDNSPQLSPDLDSARAKLTPRTRALLTVHYFGFQQNLRECRRFCDDHQIALIEDCAHVLGIKQPGLGTMGDVSVFSWRKFLPLFDGGELRLATAYCGNLKVTSPPLRVALRAMQHVAAGGGPKFLQPLLRAVRHCKRRFSLSLSSAVPTNSCVMEASSLDFDLPLAGFAMTDASKLVLRHSQLEQIRERRRTNYVRLADALANIPGLHLLFPNLPPEVCPYVCPVLVDVLDTHLALRRQGIPATAWEGVRPPATAGAEYRNANFFYNHVVFLPIHQNLGDDAIDLMADVVAKTSRRAALLLN
jgi:dTDP-4-amino-4,6-dideoxygalactose transaminase